MLNERRTKVTRPPDNPSSTPWRSFLCLADASRLRELSKQTRAVSKGAVFSDPSLLVTS